MCQARGQQQRCAGGAEPERLTRDAQPALGWVSCIPMMIIHGTGMSFQISHNVQCGAPLIIIWFVNPMNIIGISYKDHKP